MKKWREYGIRPSADNKNADDSGTRQAYYYDIIQENLHVNPEVEKKGNISEPVEKWKAREIADSFNNI